MQNPSDLLTPEQVKACAIVGVNLPDLDADFWNKIKQIQNEAFSHNANIIADADPVSFAAIATTVNDQADQITKGK